MVKVGGARRRGDWNLFLQCHAREVHHSLPGLLESGGEHLIGPVHRERIHHACIAIDLLRFFTVGIQRALGRRAGCACLCALDGSKSFRSDLVVQFSCRLELCLVAAAAVAAALAFSTEGFPSSSLPQWCLPLLVEVSVVVVVIAVLL